MSEHLHGKTGNSRWQIKWFSAFRRSCLRPLDEQVSACGRRNEAPRRTREKTSGTQGTFRVTGFRKYDLRRSVFCPV